MREKPLNSIFWLKTQFCFISSLCRAQSLRLSIPPPHLKTPHQKLCTNPANSSSEINLLCLLLNIYSDIYQENLKGKPNICISSIAWAGEQGEEGSFVITPKFPCKNQLSPLQIKEEILIYSGDHGASVGWALQSCSAALQNFVVVAQKKLNNEFPFPWGNPSVGVMGPPPPGAGNLYHDIHTGLAAVSIYKTPFSPLDFRWASYFWFMISERAEGWSVRCCAALLPLLVLH